MFARYEPVGGLVNQGISAEMIAEQWDLSREELDVFAAGSQQRAATATAEARFDRELVPIAVKDGEGHETGEILGADEGIRPGTTRRDAGDPQARLQA